MSPISRSEGQEQKHEQGREPNQKKEIEKKTRYKPTYLNAILGPELYNYMGNRVVLSTTTFGNQVAVKHKPSGAFVRSEADMMHFAHCHEILAPKVPGVYDVEPQVIATVTTVIPEQSLDKVWYQLTRVEREGIKRDLKEQIQRMRCITAPYIGRVNEPEMFKFFDRLNFHFMGPFQSEEDFDAFCLARIKKKFVLTHGDLAARNIVVHHGKLSGIVDWEYSGFFPEYMESVCNFVVHDQHEEWWVPRSTFVGAVKDRG
ncbi:hypothetical protein BDW74DRAFT_189086 [Aspergillus multicolor]|uniref:uncharacterized protein n=1 Tax=Aspergillus multicolor TaxID=41759 RepID=UPI003CCE40D0